MTITLQAVNELIASLENAGELSIKETKVMALAKAFKQLVAENVELKQSERELDNTCAEEFGQDWVSELTETPATDRIVAEAEARGIEKFAKKLESRGRHQDYVAIANAFANQLREGAK
ncbi:TPA: hypothetical protein M2O71_000790 [Klebsiella pneumoniae]|jgi:uncharacterized tellurite resistance protein B-like protein|uniref:hypothetical protein n=1 Tax=Klebsiella pneumoniae TaxID=573 RepID=UPI0020684208|nr:MAG TPA: hypothetical protein [Caudoviricetes sp.]HBY7410444.1 hypothetical protein [Klebsiella pneumoniae]HDK7002342.1 hypothetical protein [Klebsiella pneumoniae]